MSIPIFYNAAINSKQKTVLLDENTSRHIVQVLRMKTGSGLHLTDGGGNLFSCQISMIHKKHCEVEVVEIKLVNKKTQKVSIAISLLKNTNRFEWFLEKATEIGVSEIIPLICDRTEVQKFRYERMKTICISAMLQSQQYYLPVLREPTKFNSLIVEKFDNCQKLIAYCSETEKQRLSQQQISKSSNQIILIGPEGDFSKNEIELAIQNKFIPVSLGENRLRTETAAVVAATLLCI